MSVNYYNKDTGELVPVANGTLFADAPVGAIQAYGGATAPLGWLLCQGQAVSRTEYAELFAAIGTAFGEGDSSTTFNVPDYRGKVPFGADANNAIGTDENGALPNIKGGITGMRAGTGGTANGCVQTTGSAENVSTWSGSYGGWNIDASRSSTLYKDGQTTVVPANVRVNYIIKAKQVAMPVDIQSAIEEQNSYSTEETYTGKKWIDGKPIYRKVLVKTGDSSGTGELTIGTISNFAQLINITTITNSSSGANQEVEFYRYRDSRLYISNGIATVRIDRLSNYNIDKVTIIVEYTKTT